MSLVIDRIVREIEVDAPVWQVWTALTDPGRIRQWHAYDGAQIDARVGGTLTYRWTERGVFHGTVEEVDPPHRLAYRLARDTDDIPRVGNSTRTEFTLTADGDCTRVRVEETGFAGLEGPDEARQAYALANDAVWHERLARLAQQLET